MAFDEFMKETELKESWCVIPTPPVTITTSITLLSNEHLPVDKSVNTMSQPTSLDVDDDNNSVVDNDMYTNEPDSSDDGCAEDTQESEDDFESTSDSSFDEFENDAFDWSVYDKEEMNSESQKFTLTWTADDAGFQPKGDHFPVAPVHEYELPVAPVHEYELPVAPVHFPFNGKGYKIY
ncbi:hypothetical protein OUZ56_017576 [Daphnia magna]|uniref:Uncharacterized protein n=1 Tax=Daphnia magna TaxID=35525 RepID=A0ABR0AT98_9CRUS|nr:hypothetical protein OUZ56_017576 [Daphnia magna]